MLQGRLRNGAATYREIEGEAPGTEGQHLTASFSFRKRYERAGRVFDRQTALALRLAIEALIVTTGPFTLMETKSTRR